MRWFVVMASLWALLAGALAWMGLRDWSRHDAVDVVPSRGIHGVRVAGSPSA